MSSSTPTIIEYDGKVVSSIGASGGSQIISATAQTILRMLDMDLDPFAAVHQPRIHHQLVPNELVVEKSFGKDMINAWKSKGHNVTFAKIFSGVTVASRTPSGLLQSAGDLRKDGSAVAF
jgi:gamma-glutamyltranspeptidase/glutathione hydrolase